MIESYQSIRHPFQEVGMCTYFCGMVLLGSMLLITTDMFDFHQIYFDCLLLMGIAIELFISRL